MQAHRRLNRVLSLIFFVDEAGALIAYLFENRWLACMWLASGVTVCLIGTTRRALDVSLPDDDEFHSEDERIAANIFASRAFYLGNLLGATALAVGSASGCWWWSTLLCSILIWFVSLFAILLLCSRTGPKESER
jgi:hypothetical protein